jgi:hypothetical protein
LCHQISIYLLPHSLAPSLALSPADSPAQLLSHSLPHSVLTSLNSNNWYQCHEERIVQRSLSLIHSNNHIKADCCKTSQLTSAELEAPSGCGCGTSALPLHVLDEPEENLRPSTHPAV